MTSTTSDFLLHYVQSADFFIMCNILWNEKSVQKNHTVHNFLLLYVKSALERKVGSNFYTVPETLLSISSFVHKYPNIQKVNIIAIIASDFTSNFGFCGLGAYHSFCTKNSQTLLSISSFVHKYPKCQHHCYHCQ